MFSLKYGFDYVKDTIIGHDSKELLETKNWVTSDYGAPPITITTPKVLRRLDVPMTEEMKQQIELSAFGYGSLLDFFSVSTNTYVYKNDKTKIEIEQAVDATLQLFEQQGVQNLISKRDKFETPNGAEGLKTHGNADFPVLNTDKFTKGNYVLLTFTTNNVVQQVVLRWRSDDKYSEQMVQRILNSVELVKPKTE